MSIKVNFNNMMKSVLGKEGISDEDLLQISDFAKQAHEKVERGRGLAMQGWMDSPYNQQAVVAQINAAAKEIQNRFENFVVLGIGGSALGPIAVFTALKHLYYNELPKEKRGTPRFTLWIT